MQMSSQQEIRMFNSFIAFSLSRISFLLPVSPQEDFIHGALAQLEAERDEARRQLEEEHRLHMAARHQTALALSLEQQHHSHNSVHSHDHEHDHSDDQLGHCEHSHEHSG